MGFFDKIRNGLKKTKENIGETFDSVLAVFRPGGEKPLGGVGNALIFGGIRAPTAAGNI